MASPRVNELNNEARNEKNGCHFPMKISWNCILIKISHKFVLIFSIENKWTLIKVMLCTNQATSHCRMQCSPRSILPYVIGRSQWVNKSQVRHKKYYVSNYIYVALIYLPLTAIHHLLVMYHLWNVTGSVPYDRDGGMGEIGGNISWKILDNFICLLWFRLFMVSYQWGNARKM